MGKFIEEHVEFRRDAMLCADCYMRDFEQYVGSRYSVCPKCVEQEMERRGFLVQEGENRHGDSKNVFIGVGWRR